MNRPTHRERAPLRPRARNLFRTLVESIDEYAIFMLEPDGRVASWNAGAERIKGYTEDEIIGQHFSRFYTDEDVEHGKPEASLRVAAERGKFEDEGWRVRKDGTLFWASVVLTPIREDGELVGFAKVTRDLTERRRADEARRALEVARQAVRARDEFLSIASHELRTPLTSLTLQAQSLQRWAESAELPEPQLARVHGFERHVERLARLVQNLLNVSTIASGQLRVRRDRIDLAALLGEVVTRWSGRAEREGCSLELHVSGPVDGEWDPAALDEVVSALIENALKYGHGRPVVIRLEEDGDLARVHVTDSGIGISPADQARIFERFERAVPVAHFGGFGLGLWAARQIVNAHGGDIAVESRQGEGSRFSVWLPRRAPEARAG
jgi:PAS domain S-box-containing protein